MSPARAGDPMRRRVFFVVLVTAILLIGGAGTAVAQEGSVGVVDTSTGEWYLLDPAGNTTRFFYGNPGDLPIVGDWDCDGDETPGLYRQSDGFVYLRNSNTQGPADIRFFFGNPGDVPLSGDFDGDGCDSVSIYRPSEARIYVINALGANDGGLGAADFSYVFGDPGDKPYVGDFDNDTVDEVGLHRESTGLVYFRFLHTQGVADAQFIFGDPGDKIIAAEWAHRGSSGPETVGLFRPSTCNVYLRYTNTQGVADETLTYGTPTGLPVAGDFGVLPGGGARPAGCDRFWADDSPFNVPVADSPLLDSGSRAMAAHLATNVIFDLYEFGIAIHFASASSPQVDVSCTANWGECPADALNPIAIPSDTNPPPGSDGNTVIVDWSKQRALSMHQPRRLDDGSWSATWVTVADLRGSGVPAQGGNGSGVSHLAGVVELGEITSGHIDHALVFSTDIVCADQFRYPARKTDGQSTRPNCIPLGTRVQLDPTIDLDALGLPPGVETVARALQEYGAYAVDSGGAPMALYFQVAPDARAGFPGKVYADAGMARDYFSPDKVPWDRLRVLANWDGN